MHVSCTWVGLQGRFFFANLFRAGHGNRTQSQSQAYVCLHPGCKNFNWANPALLEEHMIETHSLKQLAAPAPAAPAASASIGSDQRCQGSQGSLGYQPACGSSAKSTTFVSWKPDSPSDSTGLPTTAAKPFYCGHEGCNSSFFHYGDLNRHEKIHVDGPRPYNCYDDGCNRKGNNGFTRLDKLGEHVAKRHPLTEQDIYLKKAGPNDIGFHRFQNWREERHNWLTEHPSDEMPPWLAGNLPFYWNTDRLRCPKCQVKGSFLDYVVISLPSLREHWQTYHSSVEMPLWMTIDEIPYWARRFKY